MTTTTLLIARHALYMYMEDLNEWLSDEEIDELTKNTLKTSLKRAIAAREEITKELEKRNIKFGK